MKRYSKTASKSGHKKSPLKIILSLIIIAAVLFYSRYQEEGQESQQEPSGSYSEEVDTSLLELPQLSKEDKIINYRGFKVSYNSRTKIPNWVAWELEESEIYGKASREGMIFMPDNSLPYPQAEDYDYRNSGWTRGHMAPAADFKWSKKALEDTFHFTNCCPQDASLNGGMWDTLEKKTREAASEYGKVWVVTGPIIGENRYGAIGENSVTVPDAFFKALMIHDGNHYQTIAFIMENRDQRENMRKCAMSVNKLEEKIKLNLFDALDDDIEEKVESNYKLSVWGL